MRLYDTLSRQVREFRPLGDEVKMYVCGVTPYGPGHVGHALSYVFFDVLRRYLEFRGFRVRHVQNFTDVDDKIIAQAHSEGVEPLALAERHINQFFRDMDALNVKRAHVYPRATGEIPRMIEVIRTLEERGYAYQAEGDVYFRITRWPEYGKLSHRSLEEMMAGARVEVNPLKEHPMDFTLWKSAKPGEPSWDSPWGKGRPGWHIECSVMSLTYLGETLDIHGGGQDLIFPHHENEIAQSEAYTGKPFARFWVHNGLLRMGQDKMSKSLGNLVTIEEALRRYSPDALRLFFLTSHYRSPLAYSEESLESAERAAERLRGALEPWSHSGLTELDPLPFRERFVRAMDDDLNTPQALAVLFDLAREINRSAREGLQVARAQETLRELGGVLGLTFRPQAGSDGVALDPYIQVLVDVRSELRARREFSLADRIRDRLAELGVALEDTPSGTLWRLRQQRPRRE